MVEIEKLVKIKKYKQLKGNEIENLKIDEANEIKLLPSTKNYDWYSTKEKAKNIYYTNEIISMVVARYSNLNIVMITLYQIKIKIIK